MLKVGIIGLGDIAQKAYLPVISRKDIELHLCTRDQNKLRAIGTQYRLTHLHDNLDSLISSGIKAVFVHTATAAHEEVILKLLENNIHVYVDKPITSDLLSTQLLLKSAQAKKLILMPGFNRRFAPAYNKLNDLGDVSMILLQKNRKALPAPVRTFIFDDFIHVVDSLLFLFRHPINEMIVSGKQKDNDLYHVTLQLIAPTGETAIGIMNRDSGTTEERLEVFTSAGKRIVYNVSDEFIFENKNEIKLGANDWEPTLHKRGFEQIVDHFLGLVESESISHKQYEDALLTHRICEEVVQKLMR
jgi:virulence factor